MAVINTNVKALYTQYALKSTSRAQTVAMEQLSTGKRVNSARDDAAGMAIANRMSQQIRSLDMAVRNAGDAISLIQTAEGATGTITDMLQRMRELAIQAINDTNASDQRGYLDLEFQQLKQQIVSISEYTEWNGFPLLNGKVGEPVGERPVYKTVSAGDYGQVFIDPTTTRTIAGANSGKLQTIQMSGATYAGVVDVGGVSVQVEAGDTAAEVATKVASALRGSDAYGANSGRTVSITGDNLDQVAIQYSPSEGDDVTIAFTDSLPTEVTGDVVFPETQTIQFGAPSAAGDITVGGVTVSILDTDTAEGVATKVAAALTADATFNPDDAKKIIKVDGDTVTIAFNATEADPADITFADTDSTSVTGTVSTLAADTTTTQTLTLGAATNAGALEIGGLSIQVAAGDSDEVVAGKVAAALQQSNTYGANAGYTVVVSGNQVIIDGPDALASGDEIAFADAGATGATGTVSDTYPSIVSTNEQFINAGKFLMSGTFELNVSDDGQVNATFTDSRGEVIELTGASLLTDGKVTFNASEGNNSKVISDTLTYTFSTETAAANLTDRAVSLTTSVTGSIPAMKTGDLVFVQRDADGNITGEISIPESEAVFDKVSPPNNAAASAIAIAAAINSKTGETGISAVVNKNIMTGAPMSGASVVSGNLVINGYSTPKIETIYNNPRDSRAAIVDAINFISAQTGVVAINTGSDAEGIRLEAADGRNIEVSYANITSSASDFAARVGVNAGVQTGTYSLEARVETPIEIKSIEGGDISRARLTAGAYTQNVSTLTSDPRLEVTSASGIMPLKDGDLIINGVTIPGTRTIDDKFSNTQSLTSDKTASALAIANAINSQSADTGVTAKAVGAQTAGEFISRGAATGSQSLYINGIEVKVDFSVGTTTTDRVNEVIKQVNLKVGEHGVMAAKTPTGALNLQTVDGRNLSVWFDQKSVDGAATVTAANFGLGADASLGVDGVTAMNPADATVDTPAVTATNFTGASTVYGRIELSSPDAFEIEPGTNGFSGNFLALGFQQGVFGGEVNEATTKMTPPNVGRLTFHVGASAYQTIHIDFADYGAGGPITGDITGDVALSDSEARVNRIDNAASATAVLAKIDAALDKVNGNRAVMGAMMNRLDYIMENLTNVSVNTSASRSQIQDADYAKASTELARTQIMQQAATAVLAQANMDQQTVLKLLQ